jgi:hypothetical protein
MIVGELGKKKRKANAPFEAQGKEALSARRDAEMRKADSQKWLSHCEVLLGERLRSFGSPKGGEPQDDSSSYWCVV